jgi:hypothetical protein
MAGHSLGHFILSCLFPDDGTWNPPRRYFRGLHRTEGAAMLSTILIIVLILILIGALPTWGYSGSWGYGPGGIVGVLLIIVIVLALTGRL